MSSLRAHVEDAVMESMIDSEQLSEHKTDGPLINALKSMLIDEEEAFEVR